MANMTELEINTYFRRRLQDWGRLEKNAIGQWWLERRGWSRTGTEDNTGQTNKQTQARISPPTNPPSSLQKIKVDVRSQLNLLLASHVHLTLLCSRESANPPVYFSCQMSTVLTVIVFLASEWGYVMIMNVLVNNIKSTLQFFFLCGAVFIGQLHFYF